MKVEFVKDQLVGTRVYSPATVRDFPESLAKRLIKQGAGVATDKDETADAPAEVAETATTGGKRKPDARK